MEKGWVNGGLGIPGRLDIPGGRYTKYGYPHRY